MRAAAFLDRDGVINVRRPDHVTSWEQFEFIPGATEAIVRLAAGGFPVVIVTNQRAVGRGQMQRSTLDGIHARMEAAINAAGGSLAGIYVCPHDPDLEPCACRKPQPGLLLTAARELNLDLGRSVMIGDSHSDIVAGKAAGCQTVWIRDGRAEARIPAEAGATVRSLAEAADLVLARRIAPPDILVSVIIPTFDCGPFLGEALDSVFAQGYPSLEVIVVDDGSTDETEAVLAQYAGRIQVLGSDRRGPGGARNVGLRAARGELIAFLDADDLWLPGKLEAQIRAMRAHPEAGLCFTEMALFDESGVVLPCMLPEEATGIRGRCLVRGSGEDVLLGYIYSDLLVGEVIQMDAVVVRRACLSVVGAFDEALPAGAEDYDLWLRIAQRWPVVLVDRVLGRYRLRAGSASASGVTGGPGDGRAEWRRRCRRLRDYHGEVRRRHLERIPKDLPVEARRQLVDYLLNKGWQEVQGGRRTVARAWFRKCVRYGTGGPAARAAAYWVDSYLPVAVRRTLRELRRSLDAA